MNGQLQTFAVKVPSRVDLIEVVCNMTSEFLQRQSVAPGDAEAIETALWEAVANAMRHGNDLDPRLDVGITADVVSGECIVRVRDSGKSGKSLATCPGGLLDPNGRGLLIMRSLMDSVDSARHAYGFEVVMRKRVRLHTAECV